MSAFGEVLLGRSRFLFWSLAPFLIAGVAAITLPVDYEDGQHLAAVLACDAAALLLALSLWPYHRIPGVGRLLTGTVAVAFTTYLIDAWVPGLFPRKGAPSERLEATLGFLVIGLPSLRHACLGRFQLVPAPIAIAPDEPLLLEAYERARASLSQLRSAFRDCPETTFVRFAFTTDDDEVEHLWGGLSALSETGATLEVMTQPILHDEVLGQVTVALGEIEDWEAEFPDGTVEGGFTTRAMHAYAERESLPVPREIAGRLRRYRDAG